MKRFDNVAMVRVVVADTNLAEGLKREAASVKRDCSSEDELIQLDEYVSLASSWVRCPMQLEVSTDGGKTWMPLPTKGGLKYSCSVKGDLPLVEIKVPVMEGVFGGSMMMIELPSIPGSEERVLAEQGPDYSS